MRGIDGVDAVIAPPFPFLIPVSGAIGRVQLGAQDAWPGDTGAMTGAVSAGELKEIGVTHVIVGHSERRIHAGETDEMIAKKLHAVLVNGLNAVLCVGERERSGDGAPEAACNQLRSAIRGMPSEFLAGLIVAYEPVWAISTTLGASPDTPENASRAAASLRSVIALLYSPEAADAMVIIYGGSVNADNAAEFLREGDVGGVLVGGASLHPGGFLQIVRHASSIFKFKGKTKNEK